MKADALSFRDRFSSIVFGNPLLTTEEDNQAVVQAVAGEFQDMDQETALVLMGHRNRALCKFCLCCPGLSF